MASRYARGSNFERRVKRHYEDRGFFVIRAAGSHGPVDLIAISKLQTMLIQCKLDGAASLADRERLANLAYTLDAQALIISRDGAHRLVVKEVMADKPRDQQPRAAGLGS